MKTEFLKNLGLTDEQINSIMAENGKDVEKYKTSSEKYKQQFESTKASLDEANTTIQSYKDMDIESIKKSADEYKEKFEKKEAEMNQKLAQKERDHQMDKYFSGLKFSSESAKRGIIAQFNEQNFDLKDGKFVGAEEFMNKLKETDAGAFAKEEPEDNPLPSFSRGTNSNPNPAGNKNNFGFGFSGVRSRPKED